MDSSVGRAEFFAVVMLVVLVGCQQPKQQKVWYVEEPISAGIKVIKAGPYKERLIREAASSMLQDPCTQAFDEADLRSPLQLVTKGGVVIRLSSDLYIYTAKELGLVSEATRRAYAWDFSTGNAQGGTVSGMRKGVQLTVDGRPRIFLHETAFMGESFWQRRLSLRGVLIHEFIHAGGQPRTPGILGPLQDDLMGFPHYDRIMKACS